MSTPVLRGGRTFFTRQVAGAEHPVLVVAEAGAERVLIDPLTLDPGGLVALEAWSPSLEGDLLAYQLSSAGTEDCLLRVLDVRTGALIDGPVDRVRRTPTAWLPGGWAFYYVRWGATAPGARKRAYDRRVYLHRVGGEPDGDTLVFGEGRRGTPFYHVATGADGRWLTISATEGTDPRTDLWLADLAATPPGQPDLRPIWLGGPARTTVHIPPGTGPDDPIWVRTTLDAPWGRVLASTPARLAAGHWREVVAERPGAVLEQLAIQDVSGQADRVALIGWTSHAVTAITVHDFPDAHQRRTVRLPGLGTIGRFSAPPGGGRHTWFAYTDHTTPATVLRYDTATGELATWDAAPTQASRADVSVRQVRFPARDGTELHAFVIAPTGRPDRPRPAILTGYGGFGVSMSPAFLPQAIAWARAGGVFAIACLRGGGEEGEEWHRAGRRGNKQNVFDDCHSAAGYLVAHGWADPARLAIMGSSNGGLLAGAALTQHPGTYAAAVCVAPLLDMVRYEHFGMGPSWRAEYGSADDPADLACLLSYSPYHRVRPGTAYPAVLLAAFAGDTRVDPAHARKMCAALQGATSGEGPVLLRMERGVGHGIRAASREEALQADCLAFVGDQLGLPPSGADA